MKWRDRRRSSNVEDRRGRSSGGFGGFSGFPGFSGGSRTGRSTGGGRIGIVGLIVIAAILFALGGNPLDILTGGGGTSNLPITKGADTHYQASAKEEELADFVSVVLAETETCWNQKFAEMGRRYEDPKLVLFTEYISSACGSASSSAGPFYCPGDSKVYIDLSFFDQLARQLGAKGDFAIAYVIAHEVGHHVQYQLGIGQQVQELKARSSEAEANALSVRMELQADYLAGVWAHYAEKEGILDAGDIDEAINAASKIGDDVLMGEHAHPDDFTHGTAAQRASWFKKGYEMGTVEDGDTFSIDHLGVSYGK